MQNILLLEDHQSTREWLADVIADAFPGSEITAFGTYRDAFKAINEQSFNLAVLDISLPDGSGIDLAKQLVDYFPSTYVVIATIYDDDDHLLQALKVGVHGYLLKDQPEVELKARLAGITKGDPPLSPGIARKVLRFFSKQPRPQPQQEHNLTPRETEVLTLISKGLSRKEIADLLEITDHTTAGYIKNIYRKLSVSSRAEATLEAGRLGLVSFNNGNLPE